MQIRVEDILIRRRIRKDLGDLTPLMESLKKYGLMNPIVINSRNELIAGHRRLESARRLGWKTINALVVEKEDELTKLEMEIEENIQRRNLTPDELSEAYTRVERLQHPGFFLRMWNAVREFFRRLFSGFSSRRQRRRI